MSVNVSFGRFHAGLRSPVEFELFVIAYELDQLGLRDQVDLNRLGGPESEPYIRKLIDPLEINPLERDFLALYLNDIRNRLLVLPGKERIESTPKKPRTALTQRAPTPLTAPHKSHSQTNPGVTIVRMRDKLYAQLPLLGSHVYTPHRSTAGEVDSDVRNVESEILKLKEMIENPSLDKENKQHVFVKINSFIQELGSKPATVSANSTPQPDRRFSNEVSTTEDRRYYCLIKLAGETLETPCRNTYDEAFEDKTKFDSELKRVRALVSTKKSGNHDEDVVRAMRRFIGNLAGNKDEVKIIRFRDQYHAAVNVKGVALSTPTRSTESAVRADWSAANAIIQKNQDSDRDTIISMIRTHFES